MKNTVAILSGVGIGAALMYLFDPQGGNRRRALIRDKAIHFNKKAQHAVTGKTHDLSNRAKGVLHDAKAAFAHGQSEQARKPVEIL